MRAGDCGKLDLVELVVIAAAVLGVVLEAFVLLEGSQEIAGLS